VLGGDNCGNVAVLHRETSGLRLRVTDYGDLHHLKSPHLGQKEPVIIKRGNFVDLVPSRSWSCPSRYLR